MRSTGQRRMRAAASRCRRATICSFRSRAARRDHAAHEADCDCQSQQSDRARSRRASRSWRLRSRAPQAVVLVDEAYFHFYGETVMDLIGKVPNLVVARTFSKAYGLAGLRLGVLARPAS